VISTNRRKQVGAVRDSNAAVTAARLSFKDARGLRLNSEKRQHRAAVSVGKAELN